MRRYTAALQGEAPAQLEVPRATWKGALERLDPALQEALRLAAEQIAAFHSKQVRTSWLDFSDEGALGHVEDVMGFTPRRLWVSSANFTRSSRRSLEFGYWTEDRALVQGAERFLVKVMRASEGLDPDADSFQPDLAPVEFDDAAMAKALAEMGWDEVDDDAV